MTSFVYKVLAVHNDLEIGHGTVLQTRGPLINFERRIELDWIFRTNNEIRGLDITKYTHVSLHTLGAMPQYYFDATSVEDDDDSTVLKPDSIDATFPGRWLLVTNYASQVIHNDTIGLQGGIPGEYYHFTADDHETILFHLDDFDNPHGVTHDQLSDVTPDQHHNKVHSHDGSDGSGTIAHSNTTGQTTDDHHPQLHDLHSHTNVLIIEPKQGQGLWLDDSLTWINHVAFEESWPTGLAIGGELNIGPGADDIEVLEGVGLLVNAYTDPLAPPVVLGLRWPQINELITAVPSIAGSIVWFSIYDTGVIGAPIGGVTANVGALHQWAQEPNPALARQEIFLGFAIHDGIVWQEVSSPKVVNQTAETLREVTTTVLPFTSIISGGTISEEAAFTLNQAEGVIWENNRNWHVDKSDPNREVLPAALPIVFQYVNRDFTDVGLNTSTVDPTMWDNSGVVESVPGPANATTIQRVYLDPGNNYWVLWGQVSYPNFLTAQANLYSDIPIVPFLLQNSLLLGFIIAEKTKNDWDSDEAVFVGVGAGAGAGGGGTPITDHDNMNGINPNNHHNQIHLLFGTDHSDVDTSIPMARTQVLSWNIDDFIPTHRNRYIPNYTEGPIYYPQQWVANANYISICNTETVEPAFPIHVGDVLSIYTETPPFQEASNVSLVRSGYDVIWNVPFEVTETQVWVPEVTVDTHYTIVVIKDPNGPVPSTERIIIPNTGLVAGEWNTVKLGSVVHAPGSEVRVYLESSNYGSESTVTGDWTNGGQQNTAAPSLQQFNWNNANTIVRINKTDIDAIDRTADLLSIITGSIIQFAEIAIPTNSRTYTVLATPKDLGTYIEYNTSLTSHVGNDFTGEVSTMTATIPIAQATKIVYEPGKFTPQPNVGLFTSFLQYGDVDQPTAGDLGYGINVIGQQLEQSTFWDLILIGGGGGSGGGDFIPTTFTGAGSTGYVPDSVVENGFFLRDDGQFASAGGGGDNNTDGGFANSVYIPAQVVDGGNASG